MANIQYTSTNNKCYENELGSILINQINFTTPQEQTSFASYSIVWSGDFENSQLSNDSKLLQSLSNGQYSFSIHSLVDNSILGPYNIKIESPPELRIIDVAHQEYSCQPNDSFVKVYVSGGTPPYVVSAGNNFSEPTNSAIVQIRAQPILTAFSSGGSGATFSVSTSTNNDNPQTWGISNIDYTGSISGYENNSELQILFDNNVVEQEKAIAYINTSTFRTEPTVTATIISPSGSGAILSVNFITSPSPPASNALWRINSISVIDGGSGYISPEIADTYISFNVLDGVEVVPASGYVSSLQPNEVPVLTPNILGLYDEETTLFTSVGSGAILSPTITPYEEIPGTWTVSDLSITNGGSGYQIGEFIWWEEFTGFESNPPTYIYEGAVSFWSVTDVDENGSITQVGPSVDIEGFPNWTGLFYKNTQSINEIVMISQGQYYKNTTEITDITIANSGKYYSSYNIGDPISLTGLNPGSYQISVIDNNSCNYVLPNNIEIKNSKISISSISSFAPTLLDSYGILKFKIRGYGPFSLSFKNISSNEIIDIDISNTKYITSFTETEYSYTIHDKITPGSYELTIQNNYGCSLIHNIIMPNITPISVNCRVSNNIVQKRYETQLTLPIFDTIFIPYKHIQNNSQLWQLVKNLNLKDTISIKINDTVKQHRIVRNMMDKYCLDENKIEILRLGNDSKDWFFYFYIAPSININDDSSLLNATYSIIDTSSNTEYDLILGINEYNTIDSDKPSLLRGSFLLNGLGHNQFVNNLSSNVINNFNNAYISIGDQIPEVYDYKISNINKKILKNIYVAGYTTSLNFLEQFHRLNIYVNINDTACNTTIDEYQYLVQIKNLLKTINNFNNLLQIYVYNLDNIINNGQITLGVFGQNNFILENNQRISNQYDISYYTFDKTSLDLKAFYINNQLVKGNVLSNLDSGYVIVRIKDIYNNKPKNLTINNTILNSYDQHFIESKNLIQKYNSNIASLFEYGDILLYIDSKNPEELIPNENNIDDLQSDAIEQTPDSTNTSSLDVKLIKNIKCIIRGPKNYRYTITKDTQFKNMIPGVYTIVGDEDELFANNLFQQEHRILVEKNTSYNIDVDFVSYKGKIFIKDIK